MASLSRSVTFLFKLCPFLPCCFTESRVGFFLDANSKLNKYITVWDMCHKHRLTQTTDTFLRPQSPTLIHYRQPRFTDTGYLRAVYD